MEAQQGCKLSISIFPGNVELGMIVDPLPKYRPWVISNPFGSEAMMSGV